SAPAGLTNRTCRRPPAATIWTTTRSASRHRVPCRGSKVHASMRSPVHCVTCGAGTRGTAPWLMVARMPVAYYTASGRVAPAHAPEPDADTAQPARSVPRDRRTCRQKNAGSPPGRYQPTTRAAHVMKASCAQPGAVLIRFAHGHFRRGLPEAAGQYSQPQQADDDPDAAQNEGGGIQMREQALSHLVRYNLRMSDAQTTEAIERAARRLQPEACP